MTTGISPTGPRSSSGYTRLHITPLDESLLKIIIPASVLPEARKISYHTIETFPERRYGFVELPTMDAEKIKKKLNGAVLKGAKVRIDQARPDDMTEPVGVEEADGSDKKTKKKKSKDKESKKRKREDGVLDGVELTDRKIKRGWTSAEEPKLRRDRKERDKKERKDDVENVERKDRKDKKKGKKAKSKYTEEPEMLFKTRLTPTAESRKKRNKSREVVVHEFENTTKFPTFLKSNSAHTQGSQTSEFVEGKGWVDTEGNVVEEAKAKIKVGLAIPVIPTPKPKKTRLDNPVEEEDTSSEDEASSEESTDEEDEHDGSHTDSVRPKSSGSTRSLTIRIPPATPTGSRVHPLEALYKKSKAEKATASESKPEPGFNFFGDEPEQEEEGRSESLPAGSQIPMTPYSREELEFRIMRSAAPTPDTAHANKTFRFWPSQKDVEEDAEDEEADEDVDADMVDIRQTENRVDKEDDGGGREGSNDTTDFQKTFYAQRSDINKSWRAARKASRKEKRYRENKSRGRVY